MSQILRRAITILHGSHGHSLNFQTGASPMRPVFLVDRETVIPAGALTMQSSGDGAIVSEGEITDLQVNLTKVVPNPGRSSAGASANQGRLVYADGTTGLAANVVLKRTGDEALNAAIEIARSGRWPAPSGRSKFAAPPAFFHEEPYLDAHYPDANHRLLAVARIWGVFNYFHPYKELYGEDWEAILTEILPKMDAARTRREYELVMAEMVAHVHDSHSSFLRGARELADFRGVDTAPSVELRWIENQPVVTRLFDPGLAATVAPGDVVIRINGEPVQKRIDDLSRHQPASTPQALMRDVTASLLYADGPDGASVPITVKTGNGSERDFQIRHKENGNRSITDLEIHSFPPDRDGMVFRLITPKIGYADIDRLTKDQVEPMFEMFKNTAGIIFDMRGYPNGANGAVGSHITTRQPRPPGAARVPLVSAEHLVFGPQNPSLIYEGGTWPYRKGPQYQGKTVMLIDERTESAGRETTATGYQEVNGTVLIGSPTAGADGYVTTAFSLRAES